MTVEFPDTDDTQPVSGDVEESECMFCTGLFSEDHHEENWIRSRICFKWNHALCANFEGEFLVSDMCK